MSYDKYFQCEIAARHGYPCEAHVVITEDGYLLTIHRIPCGRIGCEHVGKRGSGQPVFLQHGLLSSSADWLLSGPEKALGESTINYCLIKSLKERDEIKIFCFACNVVRNEAS